MIRRVRRHVVECRLDVEWRRGAGTSLRRASPLLVLGLLLVSSPVWAFQEPGAGGPRPTAVWSELADWVTSLAFLKDGRHLCVGSYEVLYVRDVREQEAAKELALRPGYIKSLALSPDGKLLAAGHYQTLTLLDVPSMSVKRTSGQFSGYVTGLAFSPDGQRLAIACEDEVARVVNVATGKDELALRKHEYPVRAIAFSPDGTQIATAAGDEDRVTRPGEVKIWSARDGKEMRSFRDHRQAATDVAFSPDGKFLASTGFDERVILYDLSQGKAISFFGGHSRPTNAVRFAARGTKVISAAGGRAKDGNEVKIWERDTGAELATLVAHTAKVDALALSTDESTLASGGYDKAVCLWDVKSILGGSKDGGDTTPIEATSAAPIARALTILKTMGNAATDRDAGPIRVGMIGLDTSHCAAFAKVLNDPHAASDVAGFRVVAAYPRGSADIKSSVERIPEYTREFKKMGIEVVDSIDTLLNKVDVVLLETNDGRPHLEQALAVIKSRKPLFIDKPIAASLADAIAIFNAAKEHHVPVFSSSSLRFGGKTQEARSGKIGTIQSCETESPCHLEKTHPDLFWYGIHGVESLFTVMGPGCRSVRRTVSSPTQDVVVGTWAGGRIGTFRGSRPGGGYGGLARGSGGTLAVGQYEGYRPLVVQIVKFFKTGVAPVNPEETLEIYAFMEAADESKRQHGAEVTIESMMSKARAEAAHKLEKSK